ncbi:MAG: hypothetical protein Q8941_24855, partial [Bacteroidota bacterium]|nr:hypothetical protein [Bacteroidota bacterium]
AGFNLNRRNPFDSIIRNPFPYSLSKDELSARIDIPALLPGINFFAPPGKYAVYGLVASMGILPDIFYTTHGYKPPATYQNAAPATQRTAWYPLLKGSPATGLELNLPAAAPDIAFSLILSIGICFGVMSGTDEPDQVKYAGAAKILAMA